jgi:SAM-dependent methyltransferase
MKEFWDERYAQDEYVYGEMPNEFFREQLNGLNPGNLLLPGEGEGRNAVWAARNGWKVTAVDYSEQARVKAIALAQRHQLASFNYLIGDITEFAFPENTYQCIALVFVHLIPGQRKLFHETMARALAPGGLLIMEAFTPEQLNYDSGGPRNPEMLYTAEMLQSDFQSLDLKLIKTIKPLLNEGPYHSGLASTVRLTAQKPIS